jgi:endonuclease/exonuclease/phosphatase family metal-dependent hydrolase
VEFYTLTSTIVEPIISDYILNDSNYIGLNKNMNEMAVFSLLTLNTFGIPFFISHGRIKRIAMKLNQLAPYVACLQEIQQNIYISPLTQSLTAYSDFAYFHNLIAPKGGLFTASLSTSQVMLRNFFPYPNQGHPISIGFSDWALNKGVLLVRLEISDRSFVVMNTHLQANYLADWRSSNTQTKIQLDQVSYLADLVHAQPKEAWVIVCGDFNFPRLAPAYELMVSKSGLTDALINDPRPTYRPFPLVSAKWQTSLDYIFYRKPPGETLEVTADILPIENTTAQWQFQRFLTDHHALTLYIE